MLAPTFPSAPLPPLPSRIPLEADFFEGKVDPRAFAAANPQYQVLVRNPMVLRMDDSLFFLSRFGALVAWNAGQDQLSAFHARLLAMPGVGPRLEAAGDRLTVFAEASQDLAGFNEVWVKDLSLEKLTLISLALAQSVALDRFETEVTAAMAKTQPLLSSLRTQGRIRLGHKEVLKIIGFAMDVRASVLNSLTLFEDPPETWEDEALDRLHRALSEQFDLPHRGEALNRKLAYVTDAGQILMDLLSTRKAHQLEWIVIVLIFIETAFFVGHEVLSR